MQLYNIQTQPPTLVAEIDVNDFQVKYLNEIFKKVINSQGGVILPSLKVITEQFDGYTKIPSTHNLFGKALYIYLSNEYASHPKTYQWHTINLNGAEAKF